MTTVTPPHPIDDPRLWRLYMMISDRAVDVMLFHTADNSAVWASSLKFDQPQESVTQNVEEAVYANPWLVNDFNRVSIIVDTPHYRILPTTAEEDNTELTCQAGAREILQYDIEPRLRNFIQRTWPTAMLQHRLGPLSRYFYGKSRIGASGKMYAHITDDHHLDLIVFGRQGLLMLNTFEVETPTDAVYYIMAAREQLQLQSTDELIIAGDRTLRDAIATTLRDFLAAVVPAIFPASLYGTDPHLAEAPFPLIVMPLCE